MKTPEEDAKLVPVVIRTARRRRDAFTIRPEDGSLVVLAPLRVTDAEIVRIVERNRSIVERLRRKFEENSERRRVVSFTEGSEFPFLGKPYRLHFTRRVLTFEDGFYVPAGDEKSIRAHLETLYRHLAAELLDRKVRRTAERFHLTFRRIRIGGASGRWGSCSRDGSLNFSWRLILWPEPVVDYVVVHELAHLLELNHSDRFWRQVERMCPDYRKFDRCVKSIRIDDDHNLHIVYRPRELRSLIQSGLVPR